MTGEALTAMIEEQGLEYALRTINPDVLKDAALGESLADVQDAFEILCKLLPHMEEMENPNQEFRYTDDYDVSEVLDNFDL